MNQLQQFYLEKVAPSLKEEFNLSSVMQIPRIEKVVLNMTAGNEVTNSKAIEEVLNELSLISGQKAYQNTAKKSLASWKLRKGMPVGGKVTLRRDAMWEFLYKLINIAIPRIRDFRGISSKSFDGRGNFALGIKEIIVFPEISFDKIRKLRGLDIIIVTSAPNNQQAKALLSKMGFPFAKKS